MECCKYFLAMSDSRMTIELPQLAHRRLVSLNLAYGGWETALQMLREIRDRKLLPSFGLFEGLMTAACVLYGRPFKAANGLVKLTEMEDFSEFDDGTELRQIHAMALDSRDKVLAHPDFERWEAMPATSHSNLAIGEIHVHLESGRTSFESVALLPPGNLHELMPRLLCAQIERVNRLRLLEVMYALPEFPQSPMDLRIIPNSAT